MDADSDDTTTTITTAVISGMKQMTDDLATSDLGETAAVIWIEVSPRFHPAESNTLIRNLTEEQTISRVYRIRRRHCGGNMHGVVEFPPLSLVKGTQMQFFSFHLVTANADPTKPVNRIIGWAHPELKAVMVYSGTTMLIDGTFRCVHHGFHQCVVALVGDPACDLFTPVYYILTTSRTYDTYWDLLTLVIKNLDEKVKPAEIVCDFELGLMYACQGQFQNAEKIECLFHFKQAIRSRMKKFRISNASTSVAMQKGALNMLAAIPPEIAKNQSVRWEAAEIKNK